MQLDQAPQRSAPKSQAMELTSAAQHTGLKHEDLLDALVSQLSDFVVVLCDSTGRFVSWHPGVLRQLGYTAEEFIGRPASILLIDEDRLRGVAEAELETAARTGRASDTRWLQRKDGRRILVEGVTLGLRNEAGELAGYGKVLRDVTERKRAEDNFNALARALDQSIVLIRRWDGLIEHWNAGCERLYGWTAAEAVGRIAHHLLQTQFPAPLAQIEEQLLHSGTWQGELRQKRRDGTEVFVSAHWVLLTDAVTEHRRIISTHTDITARLQMQEELETANARLKSMALELERSNEELEQFARMASHDLSAPITSTRWLVDLLSARHGNQLDAEGQKFLKQITLGLDRMADLIDAVLAHSLVGKSSISSQVRTSAEVAWSAAVANLQKDIQTSKVVITRDPLPELYIQSQPLTRLFQNLLSNAIKYRRPEVPLQVKVTVAREGSMYLIGIHDNGMGIEPEWFERIFQPMQRRHGAEVAGSGIGLATCKKIVTRAGGRIWVESEVGVGSSFYFTLPAPRD